MENTNLPEKINKDNHIIKLEELNIKEYEDKYYSMNLDKFPKYNALGYELYDSNDNRPLNEYEKTQMILELEKKVSEMLDILRISRTDPNSTHTPYRVAKMLVKELLNGRYSEPPKITVFPNRKKVNNLIISQGIEIMSLCSHHWQTISGRCVIGYIPQDSVIGISKLSRIVQWFSRRPQIQEELGEQIADYIQNMLKPQALGVVIKAKHYCMIARGVEESEEETEMITSVMRGDMMDDQTLRNEFLSLIKDF